MVLLDGEVNPYVISSLTEWSRNKIMSKIFYKLSKPGIISPSSEEYDSDLLFVTRE